MGDSTTMTSDAAHQAFEPAISPKRAASPSSRRRRAKDDATRAAADEILMRTGRRSAGRVDHGRRGGALRGRRLLRPALTSLVELVRRRARHRDLERRPPPRRRLRLAAGGCAMSSAPSWPISTSATSSASTHAASSCTPARRRRIGHRLERRPPRLIAAVAGDRVVGVGDGDDARAERDVVALEPVGVARAVVALVVVAHHRADPRQQLDVGDDAVADGRMAAHDAHLGVVELRRLAQDLLGDADLADVVQEARRPRSP